MVFLGMLPIVYADTRGRLQIGFVAIMLGTNSVVYVGVSGMPTTPKKDYVEIEILTPILQTLKG